MFPRHGEQPRPQPTQPDPVRSALHQAHLRSPVLVAKTLRDVDGPPRLYRYVKAFAMGPAMLNKAKPFDQICFNLSADDLNTIPGTVASTIPGERPVRHLDTNSQTYRLRCVTMPPSGFPDEKTWLEGDCVWPDCFFMDCNGVMLETRRKLHHGKYLPIDLTTYLQEGLNVLTVCINRMSNDQSPFNFALAVEVVGVMSHEEILHGLKQLSAEDSIEAIKRSLSGSDDDDDIAITSSNTHIKIVDPYYGDRLVTTPVRGSECKHRDVFDLETFLANCKREQPGWPTVVDTWKCPICRGDVRPHTLLVDGFIVDARRELIRKAQTDTKAIIVNEDGTWAAKEEERSGVRSDSLEREERSDSIMNSASKGNARGSAPPKWKKVVEVIELD
jgi:hypothetical protein